MIVNLNFNLHCLYVFLNNKQDKRVGYTIMYVGNELSYKPPGLQSETEPTVLQEI